MMPRAHVWHFDMIDQVPMAEGLSITSAEKAALQHWIDVGCGKEEVGEKDARSAHAL